MQRRADNSAQVVQLTKWKHNGKTWVVESTTNMDKDTFESPHTKYPNASLGDTYDQDTGEYHSPVLEELDTIRKSKGGISFFDQRVPTGFSFGSGKQLAGPHTISHVSKRVLMGTATALDRNLDQLIGSKALPNPKRVNRMLRNRYRDLKDDDWAKKSREKRTKYLEAYKKQWRALKKATVLKEKRELMKRCIELNPATVYKIAEGKATKEEMKTKGERRTSSVDNVKELLKYKGKVPEDIKMKLIDTTGSTDRESLESRGMLGAMLDLIQKDEVDQDDGSEESDSVVDLDDESSEEGDPMVDSDDE